jgi:hypothetical protein
MQEGGGPQGPFGHPQGGYGPAPEFARPDPPPPGTYGHHLPAVLDPDARGPDGCLLACPRCSATSVTKPSFTWWGGMVGPALFTHRTCGACGFGFNGKSGKSNATAIAIYFGVVLAVAIVLIWIRFTVR